MGDLYWGRYLNATDSTDVALGDHSESFVEIEDFSIQLFGCVGSCTLVLEYLPMMYQHMYQTILF
jgi:hypothetical protein